jgi:translocation protein SEC66
MTANTKLRESLDEIQSQAANEREWWERRRGQIQNEFMKELDESEKSSKATSGAEDEPVIVDTPSKASKKKGKK